MEESAVVVILSAIMWVALLVSIANDRKRDRRGYQERLERERRRKKQQALHASTVKCINIHPINLAALRWIKEAELDASSKNPDEVNWASSGSEVYVLKYLIWSIDRLSDQGYLDDEMELDMGYALEYICLNEDPEKQTGYFLEHSEEGELQLVDRLRRAANLDQSARLVVDVFKIVIRDNPHLRYDPDREYYWHDSDGRHRPV